MYTRYDLAVGPIGNIDRASAQQSGNGNEGREMRGEVKYGQVRTLEKNVCINTIRPGECNKATKDKLSN